jgi:hypothetical protein
VSCGHGDGFIYGVVNDDRHELYGVFECYRCVLNVLGPCFAELGNNFSPLSDTGTWLMSFAMILGRACAVLFGFLALLSLLNQN